MSPTIGGGGSFSIPVLALTSAVMSASQSGMYMTRSSSCRVWCNQLLRYGVAAKQS